MWALEATATEIALMNNKFRIVMYYDRQSINTTTAVPNLMFNPNTVTVNSALAFYGAIDVAATHVVSDRTYTLSQPMISVGAAIMYPKFTRSYTFKLKGTTLKYEDGGST